MGLRTAYITVHRVIARARKRLTARSGPGAGIRIDPAFVATFVIVALGATSVSDPAGAGAASPADQGVTSTIIRVGFPVINFAALAVVGVHLNDGNFQDAISALTANMNAHGGIDGRKFVPYIALDNPALTSSSLAVCTQLTEDDHVFVVILPVYPDCYQATHDTPVIDGTLPGTLPASAAPDFNLTPPDEAYDQFSSLPLRKQKFQRQESWHLLRIGCRWSGSHVRRVGSQEVEDRRGPGRRERCTSNGYGCY